MNQQIIQYFWTSAHLSGKFHMASSQTKAPISFAMEWSWTIAQSAPANQTKQVKQRISRTEVSSWDGSPAATRLVLPFPSHPSHEHSEFWNLQIKNLRKNINVNNSRKIMENVESIGQVSAYIAACWWQYTHGDSCPKFPRPWQNGVEIICCSELSQQNAEQTLPVCVVCRWTDHASQGENCGLHFQLDAVPKRSQRVTRRKNVRIQVENAKSWEKRPWKPKERFENYSLGIWQKLIRKIRGIIWRTSMVSIWQHRSLSPDLKSISARWSCNKNNPAFT